MGDPTDIVQGAQLIGLGRTRYWKGPRGLQLDVGPFLAALEHATGCTALVFGKPAPSFFAALVEELGEPARFVAMVGDDIVSDVGGAMSAGLMGVLVRTANSVRAISTVALALLHESSLARTMPTDRILTGRCDTTLVDRGRSADSRSHSRGRPHSPARLGSGREGHHR